MNALRRKWQSLPRGIVVLITALVIYIPLSFIVIQSFLSAPFFSPSKEWSLESFEFIFTDPDFYKALKSGFILAFGLVVIAIPLGGILAFLMVRTDLPGRRLIEPLIRLKRYDEKRQAKMRAALEQLKGLENLSGDLYEKIAKALA